MGLINFLFRRGRKMSSSEQSLGVPSLLYLRLPMGLAGRGGAVRFYLLAAGVEFKEDLVDLGDAWKERKQQLKESGVNPAAHVPVLTVGDKHLIESSAMMRYVSRSLGTYGKDIDADYAIDAVADAVPSWRDALIAAVFSGDDTVKAKYKDVSRAESYRLFDALQAKFGTSPAHMAGDKLSYADALVFAMLWDDQIAFGPMDRAAYPHLAAFYDAYHSIPAVKTWCDAAVPPTAA